MPEEKKPTMLVVTVYWPDDQDRGQETYGPFANDDERQAWVDKCMRASDNGWRLLHGASYLIHSVWEPFDPDALWERSGDAMEVRHG